MKNAILAVGVSVLGTLCPATGAISQQLQIGGFVAPDCKWEDGIYKCVPTKPKTTGRSEPNPGSNNSVGELLKELGESGKVSSDQIIIIEGMNPSVF
ncbi:hypothetical protein [Mesorhizobium sp. KR9-304]|uniref:hypothetical protein n=1 Tax=Mesorhizobium sp. KR9-304 TaxID=3156614 RepID=UPI0032B31CB3